MAGEETRTQRFSDSLWEVYRSASQRVKTPRDPSAGSDENYRQKVASWRLEIDDRQILPISAKNARPMEGSTIDRVNQLF
jgi:hypothetical protein